LGLVLSVLQSKIKAYGTLNLTQIRTNQSQMMPKKTYQKPNTIQEAYSNPYYQGKIVIESPEGLYSTTKDENAIKKYKKLRKKFDSGQVTTTVIPKGLMITTPIETS
jgi:hypothetical protein